MSDIKMPYKCKTPDCGTTFLPWARNHCPRCSAEVERLDNAGKWKRRFLELAHLVASWSKDPTTQVGAVAIDPKSRAILETGFNGLPRGVEDRPERMERPAKYLWTGHAEENLVAHAARARLLGAEVEVTHLCCSRCARMLINSGVAAVTVDKNGKTSMPPEEFEVAVQMFHEAGVRLEIV